jgi:hypothetical protein
MFLPSSSASVQDMAQVLSAAFPCPQARAYELATGLPGKVMHVRSLCNGLGYVRSSLLYVQNVLDEEDIPWALVEDTVARELTMSSMFLAGVLDACVIAELPPYEYVNGIEVPLLPNDKMSFARTPFRDATLRSIQAGVNGLRSTSVREQNEPTTSDVLGNHPLVDGTTASFWTLVNFWKHYFPYQPQPSEFTQGRRYPIRDFKLTLNANGATSGPVVHDLLIPVFNAACSITNRLVDMFAVPDEHRVKPIKV